LRVIGVDGDPQILEIARAKAGSERVDLRCGDATALPLEDGTAAAVVCSLLLHHLAPHAKAQALREARRVLRPGGTLNVADWGRPADPVAAAGFAVLQLIDGREGMRDHGAGRLPALIEAAGFETPTRAARLRTPFGTLELLRAQRG
jgi:SAM-dependent methyltransferase